MKGTLITWMGKNHTDPVIRQAWNQGLTAFRMGRLPPLSNHPLIRRALQEQAQIGWLQAFRGRISGHWRTAQASYLSTHHPLLSADFWTSGLIQRLFSFPWEFWELKESGKQGTRNAAVNPTCPQCDEQEDAAHLLHCTAPRSTNCWNKMKGTLITWMGKNHTDPVIRQAWNQGLTAFRMGRLPPLSNHPLIRRALQEQAQIGWLQAFRGRISGHWRTAQASYLSTHHPLLSADFWTSGLIQRLFSFPWEFWELKESGKQGPYIQIRFAMAYYDRCQSNSRIQSRLQ